MNELGKKPEISEVKAPESQGFKEIKPEGSSTFQEAAEFVKGLFDGLFKENHIQEEVKPITEMPQIESEHGGGSYKAVKEYVKREGLEDQEAHHMPADSSSELKTDDGPCIAMSKEDHMKTASWGHSKEARAYCEAQKNFIQEGKFMDAFQMDVDDIHSKFGDRYDAQIAEAKAYIESLQKAGVIA